MIIIHFWYDHVGKNAVLVRVWAVFARGRSSAEKSAHTTGDGVLSAGPRDPCGCTWDKGVDKWSCVSVLPEWDHP